MSTRSTIALEFADGTVQQIYCHFDGYLSHNGEVLMKHYQDPFKVKELVETGDLSSLDVNIGSKHDFNNPPRGECNFYGRDRGEEGTESRKFADYADYRKNARGEEYNYILRNDGNWYVESYGEYDGLLSKAIETSADRED